MSNIHDVFMLTYICACVVIVELLLSSTSSKATQSNGDINGEGEGEGGEGWLQKCDVWSLGITLLELGSGKTPHAQVVNKAKVVQAILQNDPPTLPHDTSFSADMKDFVEKCLQKSPQLRSPVRELLQHKWVRSSVQSVKEDQQNTILLDMFHSIADLKKEKEAAEEAFKHKQALALFCRHEREQEEEARDDMAEAEQEMVLFLARQLQVQRQAERQRLQREAAEEETRQAAEKMAEKKAQREHRRREAAEVQAMSREDQESSLARDEAAGALPVLRYTGEVLKRSDYLLAWNSRHVIVDRTLITYFAASSDTSERGRFLMTAQTQVRLSATNENIVVIQDASPPLWTLRLKCSGSSSASSSASSASAWVSRIRACIHYAQHTQPLLIGKRIANLEVNIRLCGWVHKESVYLGQMNRRYLVLEKGVLRYFDQEEPYGCSAGGTCRGQFAFTAATTVIIVTGTGAGSSVNEREPEHRSTTNRGAMASGPGQHVGSLTGVLRVADLTAPAPWSITFESTSSAAPAAPGGVGADGAHHVSSDCWLRYIRAHIALVS